MPGCGLASLMAFEASLEKWSYEAFREGGRCSQTFGSLKQIQGNISEARNTHFFSRGPELSFKHPHQVAHKPPETPTPGDTMTSCLWRHLHPSADIQTRYTSIHVIFYKSVGGKGDASRKSWWKGVNMIRILKELIKRMENLKW